MLEPVSEAANRTEKLAPNVLNLGSKDGLPTGIGGFRISSQYSGEQSKLMRRQFTGKANLRLHDLINGEATVAISDIALLSLAYIRSTGHDVALSELQKPNLLVPVSGTLVSRNGQILFSLKQEPWLFFGRGKRETNTFPGKEGFYEAFVLSLPPHLVGDRLKRVEAQGGMLWGDASRDKDLHLTRLTLALATHMVLSGGATQENRLAEAWSRIVVEQINNCIDTCLRLETSDGPESNPDPATLHVQKAEELINGRPHMISSLRDIAVHVGVSERTLQTAFRKVRGDTPMQVLSQARLLCARRALLDSEGPKTVSEVCMMCGIDHHGRFSKQYKEAFGEIPAMTLHSRSIR